METGSDWGVIEMEDDAAKPRRNRALKIKQGPLLYDFGWLPKPQLVPSRSEAQQAAASAAAPGAAGEGTAPQPNGGGATAAGAVGVGRKRKASDFSERPPPNGDHAVE